MNESNIFISQGEIKVYIGLVLFLLIVMAFLKFCKFPAIWIKRTFLRQGDTCFSKDELKKLKTDNEFADFINVYYHKKYSNNKKVALIDRKVALNSEILNLKNRKEKNKTIDYLSELGIVITLILSLITIFFTMNEKLDSMVNNYIESKDKYMENLDKYYDQIQLAQYKLGILTEEQYYNNMKTYYSNSDELLRKELREYKENIETKKEYIDNIKIFKYTFEYIYFLIFLILLIQCVIKPLEYLYTTNRNVIINMLEDAINKNLKIIEKEEQEKIEQEKKKEFLNDLKQILIETHNETSLINKILRKKINSN